MYFTKNNKFYHGIMFHHFHDLKKHKKSQGSIDENDFYKIIKYIGKNNILSADEFYYKFKKKKLSSNNVCLTFDDGIKSQYDIAVPILEDLKIKSFFFVYTSMFEGKPSLLEIYRYFRHNYFKNFNEFYMVFLKFISEDLSKYFIKSEQKIVEAKIKFPIYSMNEIKFRFLRDFYLKEDRYQKIMNKIFKLKGFKKKDYLNLLFMNKKDLKDIKRLGHTIGLHSHSHPPSFEKLSYKDQFIEIQNSKKILTKLLQIDINEIKSMSHPSGSYNKNTLKILSKAGLDLGFKQIMTVENEKGMKKINNSKFEIARNDHVNLISKINSSNRLKKIL